MRLRLVVDCLDIGGAPLGGAESYVNVPQRYVQTFVVHGRIQFITRPRGQHRVEQDQVMTATRIIGRYAAQVEREGVVQIDSGWSATGKCGNGVKLWQMF